MDTNGSIDCAERAMNPPRTVRPLTYLNAVLLTLVVTLQYQLWLGERGMPGVNRLEAAVAAQLEENARLEARNLRLAAEVRDLKEGLEAVEERARSDLGMIGRDETYYQLVER